MQMAYQWMFSYKFIFWENSTYCSPSHSTKSPSLVGPSSKIHQCSVVSDAATVSHLKTTGVVDTKKNYTCLPERNYESCRNIFYHCMRNQGEKIMSLLLQNNSWLPGVTRMSLFKSDSAHFRLPRWRQRCVRPQPARYMCYVCELRNAFTWKHEGGLCIFLRVPWQ